MNPGCINLGKQGQHVQSPIASRVVVQIAINRAWKLWCVVEELANRPEDLERLCQEFLRAWRPLLGVNQQRWISKVDQWLHAAELA